MHREGTPQPEISPSPNETFGLKTESGRVFLEAPKPEILEQLKDNPRVTYLPSEKPADMPVLTDEQLDGLVERKNLSTLFAIYVLEPLQDRIIADFGDQFPVLIRGTVCSLDGPIEADGIRVKDLEQVLHDGTEKEGLETLVAGMGGDNPTIHHRTQQWLYDSPVNLRRQLSSPDEARKLFPVLLVYNPKHMRFVDRYTAALPENEQERSESILRAYVLDCPKGVLELS